MIMWHVHRAIFEAFSSSPLLVYLLDMDVLQTTFGVYLDSARTKCICIYSATKSIGCIPSEEELKRSKRWKGKGKKEEEAENDNGEKLPWSEDPGLQFLSHACESYGGLYCYFFHAKDNQMKRCGMNSFPI